jgi:hypothetical protein
MNKRASRRDNMNYKIKQKEYKKSIEILKEVLERKKDNVLDNPEDELFKQHLESLRCSIELIEEDIPYLNPNY